MDRTRMALLSVLAAGLPSLTAPAALAQPLALGPSGALNLTLHYEGRLVIRVLDVQVSGRLSSQSFSASTEIVTTGILAAFRKIDEQATSSGQVQGASVFPGQFTHTSVNTKKPRSVQTIWRDGAVTVRAMPAYTFLGDPPASLAQKQEAADPLTILARITLSDSQTPPCAGVMKFFDGKQRYDLIFDSASETRLDDRERSMGLTAPILCRARFHEIAGFKKKSGDKQNQGLKTPVRITFAQAGAGGPWILVNIKSKTPLGDAVIQLIDAPKIQR